MTPKINKKNQAEPFIPTDILNDLCSRFIINLPQEDRDDLIRICFQIELAHWFYLDYYCDAAATDTPLKPCGMRGFAAHIFQHVPSLREHVSSLDEVLGRWREYKLQVPTYGAVLLDEALTHVLLVQSYHRRGSWGFPKGKVNQDEEPWRCAIREVLEETGFDISPVLDKNEYFETVIKEQVVRLYVVGGVSRDTRFQPRTRNEIRALRWFPLSDLPVSRKDMTPKIKMGISPNNFYTVQRFVKRVRHWATERKLKLFKFTCCGHKSTGNVDLAKGRRSPQVRENESEIQKYEQGPAPSDVKCSRATRKKTKLTKRQLFTPRVSSPEYFSPSDEMRVFFTFVAPTWTNFKFDRLVILTCFN